MSERCRSVDERVGYREVRRYAVVIVEDACGGCDRERQLEPRRRTGPAGRRCGHRNRESGAHRVPDAAHVRVAHPGEDVSRRAGIVVERLDAETRRVPAICSSKAKAYACLPGRLAELTRPSPSNRCDRRTHGSTKSALDALPAWPRRRPHATSVPRSLWRCIDERALDDPTRSGALRYRTHWFDRIRRETRYALDGHRDRWHVRGELRADSHRRGR